MPIDLPPAPTAGPGANDPDSAYPPPDDEGTSIGTWRGSWSSETTYEATDFVVYQGTTYRANSAPTVGEAPLNSADWDVAAQAGAAGSNGTSGVSFTYEGDWVSGTPYIIGQWVTYSGSLYYCNGNVVSATATPDTDPGWNLGMSGSGSGFNPGQVPQTLLRAGAYLYTVGAGAQGNSTAVSANNIVASPVFIAGDTAIDRMTLVINTGVATALWRLGLFADNGEIYPGDVVFDAGTVDASSTGTKEITIGSAESVARGIYWVAAKCETAYAATRGTSGPVWGVLPGTSGSGVDLSAGYLCSHAPAGFPLVWPSWGAAGTGTVNTAPRVGIRITG